MRLQLWCAGRFWRTLFLYFLLKAFSRELLVTCRLLIMESLNRDPNDVKKYLTLWWCDYMMICYTRTKPSTLGEDSWDIKITLEPTLYDKVGTCIAIQCKGPCRKRFGIVSIVDYEVFNNFAVLSVDTDWRFAFEGSIWTTFPFTQDIGHTRPGCRKNITWPLWI